MFSRLTSRREPRRRDIRALRPRRAGNLTGVLGILVATAFLTAPGALAATQPEPAGTNGYHSAYANLLAKQAANRAAGISAATRSSISPAVNEPNECGAPGWIASAYNGLYVSNELGYGGNRHAMLRARSTSVGPWELWAFCYFPNTGTISIFSSANKFWVSNELADTGQQYGMMRARSETVGAWERFQVYGLTMGQVAIRSNSNSKWVSAEFGDPEPETGMLRARSDEIGAWEKFGTELKS